MTQRPTLLLVDPRSGGLPGVEEALQPHCQVLGPVGAPEALTVLGSHPVDIILANQQLPGVSGVAFLRQVRRRHPAVVGLLFSRHADRRAVRDAIRQGHVSHYLAQSPWLEEFLATIWKTVEQAALRVGNPEEQSMSTEGIPAAEFGQYRLLERLGEGGMGAVYRAVHTLLRRVVALKVLPAERMQDPRAVTAFLREMQAVGQLHHPHIVHAYDADEVNGQYFLVMEYLDGLDLAKVVTRLGPLPVPDACELARQAALGLQHAYEHGLVHRDLKPANLMLTPAGRVKVLDLGLARLHEDQPALEELSRGGYLVGTADYLAPEMLLETPTVDTRADLYSLGCTLFELLAGRPPFASPAYQTVLQKLLAHVQSAVPAIRELQAEIPERLAAVLGQLLAKNPEERFGTPAEVAAALEPFTHSADLVQLLAAAEQELIQHAPVAGEPTEDYPVHR